MTESLLIVRESYRNNHYYVNILVDQRANVTNKSYDRHNSVSYVLCNNVSVVQVNMPTDNHESLPVVPSCDGHIEAAPPAVPARGSHIQLLRPPVPYRDGSIEVVVINKAPPPVVPARYGHNDVAPPALPPPHVPACGSLIKLANLPMEQGVDMEEANEEDNKTHLIEVAQRTHDKNVALLFAHG